VKSSVCVDQFLFPASFMDVATLAVVSKLTGGQLYFFPNFNISKHADKLSVDLQRNIQRNFGMDALMKLRSSRGICYDLFILKYSGLTVSNYFGNFFMGQSNELELPGIDCDKSFCAELKYDDKLDEKSEPCLQVD
jgi:protein transport protein SEC24